MKKTSLLLIFLVLLKSITSSQQVNELPDPTICGTTDYYDARNIDLKNFKKTNAGTIYHIPVVFHVFHPSNPQQFSETKAKSIKVENI